VEYLKDAIALGSEDPGAMITIREGHMEPLPFGSFSDPETGRVRVREVNVDSHSYRVAREYMIRLEPEDLSDERTLGALAEQAATTPEAFRDRYGYLAGG
jgi:6-phosphofructokinase 1